MNTSILSSFFSIRGVSYRKLKRKRKRKKAEEEEEEEKDDEIL
jgi:hypothetical protein